MGFLANKMAMGIIAIVAGIIVLILPIYGKLGRIEGVLHNGLIKRVEKLEKKMEERKNC